MVSCACGNPTTLVRTVTYQGSRYFCSDCAMGTPGSYTHVGESFVCLKISPAAARAKKAIKKQPIIPVYTAWHPIKQREYIMCAAIHFDNAQIHVHQPKNITTGFVVCGWKHHNCFYTASLLKNENPARIPSTQGFLTNTDRFVTREEAVKIARKSSQLPKSSKITSLFSENLW